MQDRSVQIKQETLLDIKNLITQHRILDKEADKLSSKSFLTPNDKFRLKRLKIQRLHLKDAINSFEK